MGTSSVKKDAFKGASVNNNSTVVSCRPSMWGVAIKQKQLSTIRNINIIVGLKNIDRSAV